MKNQLHLLLFIFVIALCTTVKAREPSPAFALNGKPFVAVPPTNLIQTMKVYEPQEATTKIYRGYSTLALLKKIYHNAFAGADTVVFHCQDGYRADIPLKEFSVKPSLVAFAMADNSSFELKAKKGSIPLGPFYLVWDHPNASSAAKDVYRWPYAITKIDLIDSKTAYAPLVTSDSAHANGQALFMKHCFSCHALNMVGGQRGPNLNVLFQSQTDAFLKNYMLNPKKTNPASQMSGLSPTLPDRERVAEQILRYIRQISAQKP